MAEIPINASTARSQWVATAGQTIFDYEFPIFAEADLVAVQTDAITGLDTTLVLTTDYTVQDVGVAVGGTITLVTGAAVGDIITVYRNVEIKRTSDFQLAGDFEAATLNRELDLFTMMLQEFARDQSRSLFLDPADTGSGLILPKAADRAGLFLGFGALPNADPIASAGPLAGVPVSGFGATLVDDADADAALTTLGITTFIKNLLNDTTADAALTTLGAGAFGKTLLALATGVYPAGDGSAITGIHLQGHLAGLILSNNATDPAKDIDISAGEATNVSNTVLMKLAAPITKRLDAAWAVGTNQGGLDTGTVAANTCYYVWLIYRPDTGVVDVLFSTNATAPTMPTNYTNARRIGAFWTDATPDIVKFWQDGDRFIRDVPVSDAASAAPSTVGAAITLSVPPNMNAIFIGQVDLVGAAGGGHGILFTETRQANTAPSATIFSLRTSAITGNEHAAEFVRRVDASSQIRQRGSTATEIDYSIVTLGWIDRRGRDA